MLEQFPEQKPGDPWPSARHINKLSSVFGRLGRISGGSNQNIRHGESSISISSNPPWTQHVVIISNKQINDDDTEDSGLYLIKFRWYSNDNAEWKTDDKEWELDANDFDRSLEVGDKLVAFWDRQRGMFVPANTGRGRHFELD